MSRRIVNKLGVPFALAYLLAGWLAGALHSHAGHEHVDHRHADEAGIASHHCEHHHCASHPAGGTSDQSKPEHDDHHCVVCDHLAKPPLVIAAVELEPGLEPLAAMGEPLVPLLDSQVRFVWYSRGPPHV